MLILVLGSRGSDLKPEVKILRKKSLFDGSKSPVSCQNRAGCRLHVTVGMFNVEKERKVKIVLSGRIVLCFFFLLLQYNAGRTTFTPLARRGRVLLRFH